MSSSARFVLPALCGLAACAPDRLYVEGTHGWGSLDPSSKVGDYDLEGDALTVGLSFPLTEPRERVVVERYIMGPPVPASPQSDPAASGAKPENEGSGLPWEMLIPLAIGVAGAEGTRRAAPVVSRSYGKFRGRMRKPD